MKSNKAQVRFTLQRLTAQTSHSMTRQILTTQDFTPITDEELMAVKGDNAAAVIGWEPLTDSHLVYQSSLITSRDTKSLKQLRIFGKR